jgi:cardiolipin synthase
LLSHKFWDSLTLFLLLLLSLLLLFSAVQLITQGAVFEGLSHLANKVLNLVFTASISLMIIVLVMENGSPVRTLAWILVLVYLPIIGFIFYLFFGRNWRKSRIFSRKGLDDVIYLQEHFLSDGCPENYQHIFDNPLTKKLIKLLENNNKALLSCYNAVTIIPDTQDAYNLMQESIRCAKINIHIEYFSLANDDVGKEFKEILIAKAREGIKIRLVYDAVGCWKLSYFYKRSLKKAGISVFTVTFPDYQQQIELP